MALHESTSLIAPSSLMSAHMSPWHSPVPYLFGGLAVMMGLIAFALLILACSYWNFSRNLQNDNSGDRDLEAGDVKPDNNNKTLIVFEDKYLVIMAGQQKPTFLATPSSSRTSSFGSSSSCRGSATTSTTENERDESSDHVHASTMESHEFEGQVS